MAKAEGHRGAPYSETAGLAGPSFLFKGAKVTREYVAPGLNSPALWMRRERNPHETYPARHGGSCIDDDVLDEFGSLAIATPELLVPTARLLLGSDISALPPDARLRTVAHQFGTYAFVPITELSIPGNDPVYFASCMSRYPTHTEGGRYITNDFDNLQALSSAFDTRLKAPHRTQYKVVCPITSAHVPWQGLTYPVFTMPFIPSGEMHINGQDVNKDQWSPEPIKVFSYPDIAKPVTDEQWRIHNGQANKAWQIARTFVNCSRPNNGGLEKAHKLIQHNQDYRDLKTQWRQIAIGEMLIYLLSGKRFPNNHAMNAGDWMVHFKSSNRLHLTLITTRGGLTRPMTEVDFLARLRVHREPNFGYDDASKSLYRKPDIMPFYDWFTAEELVGLWGDAQSMISPMDPTTIYQR